MTWCDLDLIFDLAVVTLRFNVLSGLFLRISMVLKVNFQYGRWLVPFTEIETSY